MRTFLAAALLLGAFAALAQDGKRLTLPATLARDGKDVIVSTSTRADEANGSVTVTDALTNHGGQSVVYLISPSDTGELPAARQENARETPGAIERSWNTFRGVRESRSNPIYQFTGQDSPTRITA